MLPKFGGTGTAAGGGMLPKFGGAGTAAGGGALPKLNVIGGTVGGGTFGPWTAAGAAEPFGTVADPTPTILDFFPESSLTLMNFSSISFTLFR